MVLSNDDFLKYIEHELLSQKYLEVADFGRFLDLMLDQKDVDGVLKSYNFIVRIAKKAKKLEDDCLTDIIYELDILYHKMCGSPLFHDNILMKAFCKKRLLTLKK
jgi:hypothetical protein